MPIYNMIPFLAVFAWWIWFMKTCRNRRVLNPFLPYIRAMRHIQEGFRQICEAAIRMQPAIEKLNKALEEQEGRCRFGR